MCFMNSLASSSSSASLPASPATGLVILPDLLKRHRIAAVMCGHKLQAHVRKVYSAASLDGDGTINCEKLRAEFIRNKRQSHTHPMCAETIECLAATTSRPMSKTTNCSWRSTGSSPWR